MPERVQQIWTRVRDFFKNMSKRLRIALIAAGAAIVVLIAVLAIHNATRPYAILYSGLTAEDLTSVVTYLDSAGVKDFKIENNDTVLVRESQASALRTQIIMQGYPSSGYAYGTYLDNIGPLSSQADREQLALYELQERLGKDIRTLDGVKDASVYLTPGEDRRFILSDNVIEATAAVMVQMQNGKALTSEQVSAIQRLVSHAMQGVEISSVTVEDGSGNPYTSTGDAATLSETMKYKLALEAQVNADIRNSILTVLVPLVGAENLSVSVHSTVDVSHTYTESLIYELPDWAADGSTGGKGIIGSQVWDNSLIRGGDTAAGGVVGTPNNVEINEYMTQQGTVRGDETEIYNAGEIDYDNTHHSVQKDQPPGTITDLTVAIAVNSAKVNTQNLSSLIHLAAKAAGIDSEIEADKIAVVSYPFYQSGGNDSNVTPGGETMILGLPSWVVYAAIAGIALFLALLLIILLLRSKKKKKLAIRQAEEDAAEAARLAAQAALEGANIMDVNAEESMRMRQDVRQFVEENPAIAAQMVKNWLRGGEEA